MIIRIMAVLGLALGLSFAITNSNAVASSRVVINAVTDAGQIQAPMSPVGMMPATIFNDDDDHHRGMWGVWGNWGWWAFMPMIVLFWGGVIWLIAWLVRGGSNAASSRQDDAVEVLRSRYARGEINREEFEQIRRDLISK